MYIKATIILTNATDKHSRAIYITTNYPNSLHLHLKPHPTEPQPTTLPTMILPSLPSLLPTLLLLIPSILATANITLYPASTTTCSPSTPDTDLTYLAIPADGTCYPSSAIGSFQVTELDDGCWSEGFLVFNNQNCDQEEGNGLVSWSGAETCTAMSEGSFMWSCSLAPIGGLGHGW